MESELIYWWSRYIWTITIPIMTNGMTIWSTWTLSKVSSLMNSPPQNQYIIVLPRTGIVDMILLNTVRPQNDIWVIGNTYPRKVRTISRKNMTVPEPHTSQEDSKTRACIQVLNIWLISSSHTILAIVLWPSLNKDPNSLSFTSNMTLNESCKLLEYIQHNMNPNTTCIEQQIPRLKPILNNLVKSIDPDFFLTLARITIYASELGTPYEEPG